MVGAVCRGVLAALLTGMLLLILSASALDTNYLLPGGDVKVSRAILKGSDKFCALTFDDGPDAQYTLEVAEVLREYGVSATFFVVGYKVERYPDQVVALAASGHEIANHSYNHPDFTKLSATEQKRQLTRTTAALENLGITPRWFRPPNGSFNKAAVKTCKGCGLSPVLWSVDPRDWSKPGAAKITSRVLNDTGNGAVILLHSTNSQTVDALPGIIEGLQKRGYRFLTMTQWAAAAAGTAIPPLKPLKFEDNKPALDHPQLPTVRPPMGEFPEETALRIEAQPEGALIEIRPEFEVPLLSGDHPDVHDTAGLAQSGISHTRPPDLQRPEEVAAAVIPSPAQVFEVYSNFGAPGEIRAVLKELEGRKLRRQ
jgi:peptidoglycan/xylan/chitin deacetylase (PgdA/CDA1 family)